MIDFSIAVVGGGHAGVEAALTAARLGLKTVLISHDSKKIGALSCNPAVGGLGKGHLVKEIDALGGVMGRATDQSAIQYRRLNTRKGPAVRATRCQVDRTHYLQAIRRAIESQPNLTILPGEAVAVETLHGRARGLTLANGTSIRAEAVILTTGTFLKGLIHIGKINFPAGRLGDSSTEGLSVSLAGLGLDLGRLKTGTPPRIMASTIDFDALAVQPGDVSPRPFSIMSKGPRLDQLPCHITRTTLQTHDIIKSALDRSAMFGGSIKGVGARYCPSIEDKIVRFADKPSHNIFIEPEGLDSPWVYPNGISTSLPLDIQEAVVHSLPGLENAELARPGYAIEYDYVLPTQIGQDLMVRSIPGLYLAGQINGTSGYEEAAAQGLMAGLNAARLLKDLSPIILTRDLAYIGVMIDDLTTLGTNEPYRMFTSRAEYRLLLREDNAADRLTPLAREWGLVSDDQWAVYDRRRQNMDRAEDDLRRLRVRPDEKTNTLLSQLGSASLQETARPLDLLKRPEVSWSSLMAMAPDLPDLDAEASEAVEVEVKYAGYVAKQLQQVERFKDLESRLIPPGLDYGELAGLSIEIVEKLSRVRPRSIGQAARIPGVTPAALMILSVHAARKQGKAA